MYIKSLIENINSESAQAGAVDGLVRFLREREREREMIR